MIYELYLQGFFNIAIVKYITFRSGLAFIIAFITSIFLMPYFISWAKSKKASQPISDSIKAHAGKRDTPTMGGVVFVLSALFSSLICARLNNAYVLLGILTLLLFMLIGFRDDYMKISSKKNAGMTSRVKLLLLFCVSAFISISLFNAGLNTELYIPLWKNSLGDFMYIMTAFWILVFISTTNAVNITDGLDGLATIPSICALASLSVFVYVCGNIEISKYLFWPHVPDSGEIMIISLAVIGALFGFLWYNAFPAQVFMGDTGSLTLGGIIAVYSILIRKELLIPILCGIFLVENISVIMQTAYFKYTKKKTGTGRRIFKMAPLHHHFQKPGNSGIDALWQHPVTPIPESKIVVRFWIIGIFLAILTFITLKIR